MNDLEYYRLKEYAMYGELAWWGILCIDKKKNKGKALMLTGMQGKLKIFLDIKEVSEKKKHKDDFVKNFSGKILYAKEIKFPSKKHPDLEEKLKEWIKDKSSKSFAALSKEIAASNQIDSLESYFQAVSTLKGFSTRDPWANFRYYWSDAKKTKRHESFFLNDGENLLREEVEDDDGEPGYFEIEKI